MPPATTTISLNSRPRRKWLVITSGVTTIVGGAFLALTIITAYATRLAVQERFNELNYQSNRLFKLNNINGGWYWSYFKIGIGITAIEIDIHMRHWGLSTYIQGQVLDEKISSTPLAAFTGRIDSEPWNKIFYWNLKLHGSDSKWRLPTGYIESHPINLNINAHSQLPNWNFDIQAHMSELHHSGFPVFHATALALQSVGTLISSNNQLPQLDTTFNLTSDSNYGPLRFEASVLTPFNNLAALWRAGFLQLRAILPASLWRLVKQWNPIVIRNFMNKNVVKQQNEEVAIIDIMLRDGNWQMSVAD